MDQSCLGWAEATLLGMDRSWMNAYWEGSMRSSIFSLSIWVRTLEIILYRPLARLNGLKSSVFLLLPFSVSKQYSLCWIWRGQDFQSEGYWRYQENPDATRTKSVDKNLILNPSDPGALSEPNGTIAWRISSSVKEISKAYRGYLSATG